MRTEITEQLERLRKKLAESEAFGPESDISTDDESEAGEGGAENIEPGFEALDNYLIGIIGSILDEYEVDEEDAVDFVLFVADSLAEEGDLPPFPEDDDAQAAAMWMGAAQSMLFGDLVLAALESEVAGEVDEESDEE